MDFKDGEVKLDARRLASRQHVMAWRAVGAGVLALALVAGWSRPAAAASRAADVASLVGPLAQSGHMQRGDISADTDVDAGAGLVIIGVDPAGPAADAGIVRGDILLRVGEAVVDDAGALIAALEVVEAGDVLVVEVLHGNEIRALEVTVGLRAGRVYLGVQVAESVMENAQVASGAAAETAPEAGADADIDRDAIEIEEVGNDEVDIDEVEIEGAMDGAVVVTAAAVVGEDVVTVTVDEVEEAHWMAFGVVVAEVMADGPAAQAGVAAGDLVTALDGLPLATPDELVAVLADYAPGDEVVLTVQQGGVMGAAIVEVPVTLGAAPDEARRAYLGVRLVTMPPMVTMHAQPAMPVMPRMPAMPGMAVLPAMPGLPPLGDVCGTAGVTIEQHFYGAPTPTLPDHTMQVQPHAGAVWMEQTLPHHVIVGMNGVEKRDVVVLRGDDAAVWTMALPISAEQGMVEERVFVRRMGNGTVIQMAPTIPTTEIEDVEVEHVEVERGWH